MKSIGIDIGTSSMKVVEVNTATRGVIVSSYREIPLGANPAFDPEIEILDALKSIAQEYSAPETRIVVGLRQDFISCRLRSFPFKERLKIIKSLPFELEDDLPFSSETAVYDARITQYLGNHAEVLAVVAPKNRIQTVLRQVQDGGINLNLLSAEALALANCYENWSEPPRASAIPDGFMQEDMRPQRRLTLRVHMGHTHTLVLAFEEDRLVGARSILWGSKNVADSIAQRYEIPFVEAQSEMKKKAFILLNRAEASYDQILFSDTIAAQVKDLGQELKISILELQSDLGGKVESVEISGGFSPAYNLHPYLTQLLELPVNKSRFLDRFTTTFEKNSTVESQIGVALGLALEGLRRPKNPPIQLMRGEFAKQAEGFGELWKQWGSSVQVVAALFLIFVFYSNLRDSFGADLVDKVKEALKKQAKDIAGLPAKQATEPNVRKFITAQRKRAQEVRDIEAALHVNTALEILKKLSDSAPNHSQVSLTISKLEIIDQKVQVDGVVGKATDIPSIEGAFGGVAKGKVNTSVGKPLPGSNSVSFSMAFDVDRGFQPASR